MRQTLKKWTLYFIVETTNDDQENIIDKVDVNAGNTNCFPRCSNLPSLYKETSTDHSAHQMKITDLSIKQIKETGKSKHY